MQNLSELLADPEFQALTYEEQQKTKEYFFRDRMLTRPDIAALDPAGKAYVYREVMNTAPAFEGLGGISLSPDERAAFDAGQGEAIPNSELKSAVYLREKAAAGDADAQKQITGWIVGRRLANETLLGQAIMGSVDAAEELFGGNTDPLIARNRSNLSKISNYLLQAQTPEQAANTQGYATLAGLGGAFLETVALSSVLIGGPMRGGLLTRGLYRSAAQAAAGATSTTARTAYATLAPLAIDAVGGGTIDVLRSLPQILQDSDIAVNRKLAEVAQTFGEGVVFDLAFSATADILGHTLSPFIDSFKKMDVGNEASIEGALKNADWLNPDDDSVRRITGYALAGNQLSKELMDQIPENLRANFIKSAEKYQTALQNFKADPRSPEGFRVLALAAGFDSQFSDVGVQLFKDDALVNTFGTLPEAVSFIGKSWNDATFDTIRSGLVSRAMRASTPEAKIVRQVEATINPKDLPNETLMGLLTPNTVGIIEPNNALAATRGFLRKAGVDADVPSRVIPADEFFKNPQAGGAELRIPDRIRTSAEYKTFLKYYDAQVRAFIGTRGGLGGISQVDEVLGDLSSIPFSTNTLSPWALEVAGERLGVEVKQVGSQFQIKTGANAPQTFETIGDANRALSMYAFEKGLVTEQDFAAYLATKGLSISDEVQPQTREVLKVVRQLRGGDVFERGDSIAAIMAKREDLIPKLPESLAPKITFIGADDTVHLTQGFISGPESSMRKMLDSYTSFEKVASFEEGVTLYTQLDGTKIKQLGKNSVELQVPDMGFRRSFNSFAEARKFLDKDINSLTTLQQLAAERGARIDLMPNGRMAVKEMNGKVTFVDNLRGFRKVLKESPDPELQPELVRTFGDTSMDRYVSQVRERLATDESVKKYAEYVQDKRPIYSFFNKAYSTIAPMRDTLERIGKATGMKEIPQKARVYDTLHRQFVSMGRRGSGVIDGLFKINGKAIDRATDRHLATLLELPESRWETAAKAINFEFTSEHRKMLQGARTLLNRYGEYFGIDMNSMLESYAPKLRDYYRAMQTNPAEFARFTAMTKNQILQEAFAGHQDQLKAVDFFARHSSLKAFLSEGDTRSIRDMMNFYIKQGLYEKTLGGYIEDTRQWLKVVRDSSAVSAGDMELVNSFYRAISGEARGDAVLADLSMTASSALSGFLKKINNKFIPTSGLKASIDEMLDDLVTTDLTAKANSLITYSTLAMRPIRGLTNMMQGMNAQAVFGSYFDDAVRDLGRTGRLLPYSQSLFERGILDTRVFASTNEAARSANGILEFSLRSQQNTEYLVRSRTARAAELAFNENYTKFAKGQIDYGKFVELSNMDIMSDDALAEATRLIEVGNPAAARDLFQRDAIRITMFEYGRENYPTLFKGVLGRMFGKFGVYPVGQVALYQRLASRGSLQTRLIRGLRLAAYSTAIYEAFKLAGIDYNGFLLYDPLTFAGGPLFGLAQDVLNSRDTGPAGSIARKNLANSYRLFIPFSSQAGKMLDAIESGSNGEIHKALVESMSGRYTYDNLLNGVQF